MGKKKIAAMVVAVVAVAASYNVYQSQNANTLSDLTLANVEALAQSESSGSCTAVCVQAYSWQCTRIYNGVSSVCVNYRKG